MKSNHSLRVTGASTLFQNNVPEEIIQKTTGQMNSVYIKNHLLSSFQINDAEQCICKGAIF